MAPGKTVRVLVFAAGEAERVAREAGADYAGVDDLVQQIQGGWLEFDAAIAMADQMGKVGGLGRILGRRGLMPNPRSGTVVRDVSDLPGRALASSRAGASSSATTAPASSTSASGARAFPTTRSGTTSSPSSMLCSGRSRLAPKASICVH